MDRICLVVHVERVNDLRGKTRNWEILAVEIGDKHVILSEPSCEVIKAAVGVFEEQVEKSEVVLPAVGIAVTEQTEARLTVLKQEATEIKVKGLNPDPQRIKIIIFGYVTQMVIDEGFLQ